MSTEKRGKPIFTNERDASITACGLLNNIISSPYQYEPSHWSKLLLHALRVQNYGKRKALGLPAKEPEWQYDAFGKEISNGSQDSQS